MTAPVGTKTVRGVTLRRDPAREGCFTVVHTDAEMAVRVANRIRRAVEEFVFLSDETPTRITVSAGVATFPSRPEIDSVDALVRAADMALYAAKDGGRNRVVQDGEAA